MSTQGTQLQGPNTRLQAKAPGAEIGADTSIKDLLSYRIHKVSSQISRSAALQYRNQFDVNLGEWRALGLLGTGAALSLNDLARAADLDKAQMSRIIAGLIKREFIERDDNATRGQTVRLALTKSGQVLYRRLIDAAVQRNEAFLACLTDKECKVLDGALDKLSALARALGSAEPGRRAVGGASAANGSRRSARI